MKSDLTLYAFTDESVEKLESQVNLFIRTEGVRKEILAQLPKLTVSGSVPTISMMVVKPVFISDDTIRMRLFEGTLNEIEEKVNVHLRREIIINNHLIAYDVAYKDDGIYVAMIAYSKMPS